MPADRWAKYQFTVPPALPAGFTDHLVSSPNGVELGVRIWPPAHKSDQRQASPPRPWVLWFHGGSTVVGTPYSIPPWVVPGFTARGYYVVSAGYRLCPHVGLGDSLNDCLEALAWCRAHLNEVFGPGAVDIARWAVGGESAGARLSTLMGIQAHPPPRVVLDLYGHTTYYPSQVQDPLPPSDFEWPTDLPPIDDVLDSVNSHDPARAIVHAPYFNLVEDELRRLWSFPSFVMSERVRMQLAIMKYYVLSKSKNYHALRLNEYSDGDSKGRQARIDEFSLVHQLERVETYPATVILQGMGDTIVDPRMSTALEAQLRDKGVPVLALYEEGAPHGFDFVFEVGGEPWLVLPASREYSE